MSVGYDKPFEGKVRRVRYTDPMPFDSKKPEGRSMIQLSIETEDPETARAIIKLLMAVTERLGNQC